MLKKLKNIFEKLNKTENIANLDLDYLKGQPYKFIKIGDLVDSIKKANNDGINAPHQTIKDALYTVCVHPVDQGLIDVFVKNDNDEPSIFNAYISLDNASRILENTAAFTKSAYLRTGNYKKQNEVVDVLGKAALMINSHTTTAETLNLENNNKYSYFAANAQNNPFKIRSEDERAQAKGNAKKSGKPYRYADYTKHSSSREHDGYITAAIVGGLIIGDFD